MAHIEPPRDIVDVVLEIASFWRQHGYEYAVGGALALAYWAAPRGTVDVDLTIFLPADRREDLLDILETLGCTFSKVDALRSLTDHVGWHVPGPGS